MLISAPEIEDEPSFADALTIGLQREGLRVAVAVDGQSALDRFEHLAPDIVLLDARIRAQLRRNEFCVEHPELTRHIEAGDVVIDVERHEVIVRGAKTGMPLREFELLALLAAVSRSRADP